MKKAKKEETKRKKRETEEERKSARTRRSKDGSWAVKNKRLHFRYKLHTIQDAHNDMIINYSTIKASVHDSQMDLSIPGIVNYKKKRYFGVSCMVIDATMDSSVKDHKLTIESIRRNLRITRK